MMAHTRHGNAPHIQTSPMHDRGTPGFGTKRKCSGSVTMSASEGILLQKPIFDFCNNIEGRTDLLFKWGYFRF